MKLYILLFIFIAITATVFSQNVSDIKKAQLKYQRFTEAMNVQRAKDSIWFYSQIEESYAISGKDTTFWILKTPKLLAEHKFEMAFDTSMTITTTIDSTLNYIWTQTVVENDTAYKNAGLIFFDNNDTAGIVIDRQHRKKKKGKREKIKFTKVKSGYAKYSPYTQFIGYYPSTSYIPSDYVMPDLPENVNPDTVGYVVIRCDNRQLVKVLKNIKQ